MGGLREGWGGKWDRWAREVGVEEERSRKHGAVLFSHSHPLSLCIIMVLPAMGAATAAALLKAGLRATAARLYWVTPKVLLTTG